MEFQPVTGQNRVSTLDILRGVSLLGILLVNLPGFYLPMPHILDLQSWFTQAKDIIAHQYLDIYIQSSFYPLFSMLFGYGLAMQFIKAEQNGARFYPFASRRLLILLAIGFMHAYLIWWGDILTQYAFCGFFLLLLIRLKPGKLLAFSVGIYGIFHLPMILLTSLINEEDLSTAVDLEAIQNSIIAYGTGSWSDAFTQRLADLSIQMSPLMWISSLFTILPYLLLGAAAAKWKLIENAKKHLKLWITLAIVCISVGLFLKNAPILYTKSLLLDYVKVYVGGPILSVGYIAGIVLLCLVPSIIKLLSPIAKAGRMSLTLYLMQSVIASVLIYNWGFGLYGDIDVVLGIYLALAIFIAQIIFAELWFMKFKQGPIEAIVKKITYRKVIRKVE